MVDLRREPDFHPAPCVHIHPNRLLLKKIFSPYLTRADEGISGTGIKKRVEFNRMIAACKRGRIDLILTKSLSRFSRNTLDCLNVVRRLKAQEIGVIFEKSAPIKLYKY